MRKLTLLLILSGTICLAQDSLKTTTLQEIVVTGTRFDIPVEKSGKTIYKIDRKTIQQNAGKGLADLLNEVPGIQTDGNFSAPGTNQSYYIRGGRNRQALILIDGVPLNDPSAISAEYDLRYIPLAQIESIEVLKGGLSTLYGTSAMSGVINITLRDSGRKAMSGEVSIEGGSYRTHSENITLSGRPSNFSWLVSANNLRSRGFSSALDNDPLVEFDNDGINRQNILAKVGYDFTDKLTLTVHSAYESFEAGYDDYEFTDAPNLQNFSQWRVGFEPNWKYAKGSILGKLFINSSERIFESSFPEHDLGRNVQGEIVHRHTFSERIQTLTGLSYQRMSMEQKGQIGEDSARFSMVDPYASVFVDLPVRFNLHAGMRLNTHDHYGNHFIYNVNPSFTIRKEAKWHYKILASVSTSYITPSLYQMYSFAGNRHLQPEESTNFEFGLSAYHSKFVTNVAWFQRRETNPIDFISLFDDEGNFLGGHYRNVVNERDVYGLEVDFRYLISDQLTVSGNISWMDTNQPENFYKIPRLKYGAAADVRLLSQGTVSLKYNFTGERTTFDFFTFSEVNLDQYHVVDLFASWRFFDGRFTLYGAINNVFDNDFVALYGYTTRGRNFSVGGRYGF